MRRLLKWTGWTLIGLVVLVAAAAAGVYAYAWLSLPQTTGTVRLAGLSAPVEIVRDRHGIPRITAANENDAWFAVGFLHAQERLFQMELVRRSGRGRLSEAVGASTVETDRFLRTLGLVQQAEASLAASSPAGRERLDAYSAGVNALITQGGPFPPEFAIAGITPEPWTAIDSLLWGGLMALQLAGNWREELARARFGDLPAPMIDELWPDRPTDAATTLPNATPISGPDTRAENADGLETVKTSLAALDLPGLLAALPPPLGPNRASNEFVVAGARSATGRPIMADDPHLGLSAPGQWYLARIETPTLKLAGATAPGVPALVLGHNGRIAWGFTTTNADIFDVFIERIDPGDPSRYLTPEGPRAFETRIEIIKVRGAPDVTFTVRTTRHGPVIPDPRSTDTNVVLALSWPAVYRADTTAQALFELNHAQSWPEFLQAMRSWHAPMQNIVYADTGGNIGFIAPGLLPRRRSGPTPLPRPGWSGEFDWDGFEAFEDLPRSYNPPSGRLVNANNRIVPDDYKLFITRDWDTPYRAHRINEILDAATTVSPRLAEEIMADSVSLFARAVRVRLDRLSATDDRSRDALDMLRRWDGDMRRERPEPLVFNAWMRELLFATLRAEAERLGGERGWSEFIRERPELLLRVLDGNSVFCRDRDGGCPAIALASLARALDELNARFGGDMRSWRWDAVHYAPFRHAVFDRIPGLSWLFGFRVGTDGDYYTVNRGAGRISDPRTPFAHIHGATYRAVYDFSDLDASLFVAPPGQSGHPLSPHWGDMAEPWANHRHVTIGARADGPTRTLKLMPR